MPSGRVLGMWAWLRLVRLVVIDRPSRNVVPQFSEMSATFYYLSANVNRRLLATLRKLDDNAACATMQCSIAGDVSVNARPAQLTRKIRRILKVISTNY